MYYHIFPGSVSSLLNALVDYFYGEVVFQDVATGLEEKTKVLLMLNVQVVKYSLEVRCINLEG